MPQLCTNEKCCGLSIQIELAVLSWMWSAVEKFVALAVAARVNPHALTNVALLRPCHPDLLRGTGLTLCHPAERW